MESDVIIPIENICSFTSCVNERLGKAIRRLGIICGRTTSVFLRFSGIYFILSGCEKRQWNWSNCLEQWVMRKE